jgi:hypothetical protein
MPYFGIPIRNGLPIGLGSVAGFGIAPFEPYSLFENGEQGAWYDPSDFSTLFTDSAGTTPVTAVEQFVGLMLDKSKGLVLGSELVANGDFSGGTTNWLVYSASAPFAVVGGVGTVTTVTSSGGIYQDFSGLTIGRTYRFSVLVIAGTADAIIQIGTSPFTGAAFQQIGANGQITGVFVASATTLSISLRVNNASAGQTCSFDNISVRELPGNHATQTTSAKRPKLAARYNLLTYTEQFDNAAWTKGRSSVTANANTAPDGTTTADKLVEDTTASNTHFASQAVTTGQGPHVFTVFAKAAERFRFILEHSVSPQPQAVFNVQAGTVVSTSGSPISASITNVGAGWYRCQVVANLTTAGSFRLFLQDNAGNTSYTGDGTSGIYIWGADLRPDSQATGLIGPTYQRVVDAATYDTAGFLPYLAFDGLDDSMSTNSIDFSAGDKMTVWAGYRISAGTGSQMLAELTANGYTTNGGFAVGQGPNAGTSGFGFLMNNGAGIAGETAAITVPYSSVISYQFDSALSGLANEAKLRRNQVAQTYASTTGTDSGTGNFANAPLYLGARLGTSVYINGWLTSLIVRGAQSTQGQIEATEAWVNCRTGAF